MERIEPKKYNYGRDKNLKPGSDLTRRVLTEIQQRAGIAQSKLASKRKVWKELDSTLNAFVTPEDAKKLEQRNTIRNVVVPVNYAMLQTLLTYFTMLYNQSPMFSYGAFGGEKKHIIGAELLNLEIQRQVDKSSMLLNLHTQWRDNYVYGFGAVTPIWTEETVSFRKETSIGGKKTSKQEERTIYVGNRLHNISPYDILPDPAVPIDQIQTSAFFGFVKHTNLYDLMSQDAADWRDGYFNIDYVFNKFKDSGFISPYTSGYNVQETNQNRTTGDSSTGSTPLRDNNTYSVNIDLLVMYIRLIPKQWKLGASDKPELWSIVTCDDVIVQCMPTDLEHGQIPVTIGAVDYDGYSVSPISRLEEVQSLQDTINWNFTSHVANVKKSLNGMIVVDPKFININDLRNPKPGKLIRMRQAGFGQDVNKAIAQLPVQDVTQNNINNTAVMTDIMRNVTAASLNASGGVERRSERVSASEANNSMQATLSRIDKDAVIFSKQAMDNLGYMLASQTIQNMKDKHWIRTNKSNYKNIVSMYDPGAAEAIEMSNYGYFQISKDLIDVNFDVVCNDSGLTGLGDVSTWMQLYQVISQNPELSQQYDMFRIFSYIAKKMGAKNIEAFRANVNGLQTQVQPTADVQGQVKEGNLVPAAPAGGGVL